MYMRERKNMNLKKCLVRKKIIPPQNIVIKFASLAFPSFQAFQPPEFCFLDNKVALSVTTAPEQDLWKVTERDVLLLSHHLPITILLTAGKEQPFH